MPRQNRFAHQRYQDPPAGRYQLIQPAPPPEPESDEFWQRMKRVGRRWRQAGVTAVYLIHGTFAGNDALGLVRKVARVSPAAGRRLNVLHKSLVDRVVGDAGNYTGAYAELLRRAINDDGQPQITVRRFQWSSEDHHIGRADAAVRLLAELAGHAWRPDERVLLCGHSHGGNVLALLTNLLAADDQTRERFFHAARPYYEVPLLRWIDMAVWCEVRQLLRERRPAIAASLDIVTFGTPIRYGWDAGGYSKLLHFVHHRPVPGLPPYRSPWPVTLDDLLHARHGDYIQQLGVAGTNIPPNPLSWRARWADARLNRLLQPGLRARDVWRWWKLGLRVAEDGLTLLVDYGPADGHVGQHLLGHAVYTRRRWMPFHAEQITQRFYSGDD